MELTKLYLVVVLLGVILVDYTSAKSSSRRSEEEKKPKQGLTALNATSSDAENGKLADLLISEHENSNTTTVSNSTLSRKKMKKLRNKLKRLGHIPSHHHKRKHSRHRSRKHKDRNQTQTEKDGQQPANPWLEPLKSTNSTDLAQTNNTSFAGTRRSKSRRHKHHHHHHNPQKRPQHGHGKKRNHTQKRLSDNDNVKE